MARFDEKKKKLIGDIIRRPHAGMSAEEAKEKILAEVGALSSTEKLWKRASSRRNLLRRENREIERIGERDIPLPREARVRGSFETHVGQAQRGPRDAANS